MKPSFQQQAINVIEFSRQLKRFVSLRHDQHAQLGHRSDALSQSKQQLFEAKNDLQCMTKLNLPKTQIPPQLATRFPFRYCRKLGTLIVKCYNAATGPQRAINHYLQKISLNNTEATEKMLQAQQQQQHDMLQHIQQLQQQIHQLKQQLAQQSTTDQQ